ncbi:MAG: hypothetical protein WBB31_14165, partial [Saprospiraceae bacterium]
FCLLSSANAQKLSNEGGHDLFKKRGINAYYLALLADSAITAKISNPTIDKLKLNPFSLDSNDLSNLITLLQTKQVASEQGLNDLFTLNQSVIIDGVVKYIAERFKAEATSIYVEKFREKLMAQKELVYIFPQTTDFLNTTNVFNYGTLGTDFKDAFEMDLEKIMENALKLLEGKDSLKSVMTDQPTRNILRLFLDIGIQIQKSQELTQILDFVITKYSKEPEFSREVELFKFVDVLQYNLRKIAPPPLPYENPKPIPLWLDFDGIKKLNTDRKVVFLTAFIYYQCESILVDSIISNLLGKGELATLKSINYGSIENLTKKIRSELILPITNIYTYVDRINSTGEITPADYSKLSEALINVTLSINSLLPVNNKIINHEQETLLISIKSMAVAVHNKKYASLIPAGIDVIKHVIDQTGADTTKAKIIQFLNEFRKYGTFMADVLETDNSDELKEVIKEHVTDFTYLDKRQASFSWTITGSPALRGGLEKFQSIKETKANIGLSLPISFEFSWGTSKKDTAKNKEYRNAFVKGDSIREKTGESFGISLQVADLGAVFNYRLNDTESELPEKITFKQILSPGISLNYGFKNTPIAISGGIQYAPLLRRFGQDNNLGNSTIYFVRAVWDIPLVKIAERKFPLAATTSTQKVSAKKSIKKDDSHK